MAQDPEIWHRALTGEGEHGLVVGRAGSARGADRPLEAASAVLAVDVFRGAARHRLSDDLVSVALQAAYS